MTKNQAIRQINQNETLTPLNSKNTHWSNIVDYGVKSGWWLNVPFHKFNQNLNLILNIEQNANFYHIKIQANSIKNPEAIFRNKLGTADIFIPISEPGKFVDEQSNSSKHDFSIYSITAYKH
ncbi:MAG: hypothetical protein K8S18_07670 [Desulfobacula sp.]|nr:hypothetical protein [Desulfobacula sp.]